MKKRFLLMLAVLSMTLISSVSASAKTVDVIIPDYECVIGNSSVYYKDSIYPMISYKDITYFPMTWDYCNALGLATSYTEEKGLWIAYVDGISGQLPIYETTVNKKKNTAIIPEYPIYVNGREIDNMNEEYPLLNFRGVTYFPMTWNYATEEFRWITNWENNVFSLENGVSTPFSYYLEEKNDDHALIRKTVYGGNGSADNRDYFYKLDYESGELIPAENPQNEEVYKEKTKVDVEIKDGRVVCEGKTLEEILCLKNGETTVDDLSYTSMWVEDFDGIKIYNFSTEYGNAPAPYTAFEKHSYAKTGDNFVFIGRNHNIEKVIKTENNIYINARRHTGWKGIHFESLRLYCINEYNTINLVNEEYPDYGSMSMLGEKDGKLYLKCTWQQEGPLFGNPQISPMNDGYFIYDGETLTKIAPYVYTNMSIMTPEGKIYGVITWKDEIKRIY